MTVPARPRETPAPVKASNRNEAGESSNLYVVRGDLAFSPLRPVREDGWPWRGGLPVSEAWAEPELVAAGGDRAEFIPVDCLSLATGTDGLVMSEFARSESTDMLSAAGEFWPVRVLDRRYWWFNCLACLDVLDRDDTDADWSMVQGDWGSFSWITSTRRLEFNLAKVQAAPAIFRVPEYPQGVLFARDIVHRWVEQLDLTGFRLDLVWSAERGGVDDPPGLGLGGIFEITDADNLRKRDGARLSLQRRNESEGRAAQGSVW
jgi:hypothetical protein